MEQLEELNRMYAEKLGLPPLQFNSDVWPQFACDLLGYPVFGLSRVVDCPELKAAAKLHDRWRRDGKRPPEQDFAPVEKALEAEIARTNVSDRVRLGALCAADFVMRSDTNPAYAGLAAEHAALATCELLGGEPETKSGNERALAAQHAHLRSMARKTFIREFDF